MLPGSLRCRHFAEQVSWEGIRDATTADAIAMYFAGDNVDTTTPLKLKWAFANSKTHLLAGTGNCRFAQPSSSYHQTATLSALAMIRPSDAVLMT